MKTIRLKVLFFLHVSVFKISCNFSSKNLFKRKYILPLALPVAIPLIYLLEKKFASNYLKRHFELPSYRKFNFFSLFFFNFYFREIPRPTIYEEQALMKVKQIKNCFYELKKEDNGFLHDKDFTQSMISNLLLKNSLFKDSEKEDHEEIAKKVAIDKLTKVVVKKKHFERIPDHISGDSENPFATITLSHSDTELIPSLEKVTVELDMNDYNNYINSELINDELPDREKRKMAALLNLKDNELVDGRLFQKKISYKKVKKFVDFIFPFNDENFEKAKYIYDLLEGTMLFSKKTDMFFILKFFDIFNNKNQSKKESLINSSKKDFENFKKILAMDFLYGIFPDTCNGLLRNLCSSESLIYGLKGTGSCDVNCCCNALKENDYFRCGPVTILEGIFFMLKKKEKNIKLLLKNNLENEKIAKAKKSLQTGRELLSFFH